MIDIDAIPLGLTQQERQPIAALYLATVVTLPDGREIVMPHHKPVCQWFGRRTPTSAHGPRGQAESKGTSSGQALGNGGERGRSQRY
ncbi:MAG: hypothetical protein FJ288_16060 [Planctomycetes bacterium]|nr:hypothetical protein [Planctomycetota bacterium]